MSRFAAIDHSAEFAQYGRQCTSAFRHLSTSIAPKRSYLAVNLTVSSLYAYEKAKSFRRL
jgi:hypothetical protein